MRLKNTREINRDIRRNTSGEGDRFALVIAVIMVVAFVALLAVGMSS